MLDLGWTRQVEGVGVGTAVARGPLHGSGRAGLPHRMWLATYDAVCCEARYVARRGKEPRWVQCLDDLRNIIPGGIAYREERKAMRSLSFRHVGLRSRSELLSAHVSSAFASISRSTSA